MKIQIDLPRAREIKRDQLRAERVGRLAENDTAYMAAMKTGDEATIADLLTRRQALLDAPAHATLDAAETPEELAAITLDSLL